MSCVKQQAANVWLQLQKLYPLKVSQDRRLGQLHTPFESLEKKINLLCLS